jgi:hypothetical protein
MNPEQYRVAYSLSMEAASRYRDEDEEFRQSLAADIALRVHMREVERLRHLQKIMCEKNMKQLERHRTEQCNEASMSQSRDESSSDSSQSIDESSSDSESD